MSLCPVAVSSPPESNQNSGRHENRPLACEERLGGHDAVAMKMDRECLVARGVDYVYGTTIETQSDRADCRPTRAVKGARRHLRSSTRRVGHLVGCAGGRSSISRPSMWRFDSSLHSRDCGTSAPGEKEY